MENLTSHVCPKRMYLMEHEVGTLERDALKRDKIGDGIISSELLTNDTLAF